MELTDQEKQQIIEQRLKQFAAEKFNHELNKHVLEAQLKDSSEENKAEIESSIAQIDESIAIIDKAIVSAGDLMPKVEPQVITEK